MPSPVRSALTVLAAGALHLAWLPWNAPYWYPARGGSSGPYETWQVVGLGVTWCVLVAVAVFCGTPVAAVRDATSGLVLVWCADNATRPTIDASLWPVGAMFLTVAALAGGAVVAAVVATVRDRFTPPGSGSASPPA